MSQHRTADAMDYPGASLGLPASGSGSLATWSGRLAALVIDWAACMIAARGAFGAGVTTGNDWRMWTPMLLFFVEGVVLTALLGGTAGQLICRLRVIRTDGAPAGFSASLVRTAMKCLVIPALIIGADRRGLADLLMGTVVVRR